MKRIGILRGGAGEDYHSSLKKGGDIILHILENLPDKYKTTDILVDKDHIWHVNGIAVTPSELINKVDVVWNTSHASFGNILESLSITNVGPSSFSGALMKSRDILRKHIKEFGVNMVRRIVSPKNAKEVFEKFGAPWIVKINNNFKIAKTFNELASEIEEAKSKEHNIIIEEFISGSPSSVHSLADYRGEEVYVLPIENLTKEEKEKVIFVVKNLHKHLGAEQYLKMDFIFHPKRGIFLTEIEFVPDLRANSHLERSCELIGAKMHHIVEYILRID